MKVQDEYNQTILGLMDSLKRILAFADKIVADKIVCEEADLLEEIIPRMYEVMRKVAKVSCNYVKHGGSSPDGLG